MADTGAAGAEDVGTLISSAWQKTAMACAVLDDLLNGGNDSVLDSSPAVSIDVLMAAVLDELVQVAELLEEADELV